MENFQSGDKVKVKSSCQTSGMIGTVTQYIQYPDYYIQKYVQVKLDNGVIRQYNESSLELIEKGGIHMVTGNYRVAQVKFVEGNNKTKLYAFALFDNDIVTGDYVLVNVSNQYSNYPYAVAVVEDIVSQSDYTGTSVTKEVICKVDFGKYYERIEQRKKKDALKKQMDKMVKDNQELVVYQMLAEQNPEMAALLDEYKNITV